MKTSHYARISMDAVPSKKNTKILILGETFGPFTKIMSGTVFVFCLAHNTHAFARPIRGLSLSETIGALY